MVLLYLITEITSFLLLIISLVLLKIFEKTSGVAKISQKFD